MKSKLLSLTLIPLTICLLAGCAPEEKGIEKEVNMTVHSNYKNTETYDMDAQYKDSYFLAKATTLSLPLARISFLASSSTSTLDISRKFYQDIEFDNYHYKSNKPESGSTHVRYAFAHRKINDFDLFSISIVESKFYPQPWVDNFRLGKSGNHAGYEYEAKDIINDFKTYLTEKFTNPKLKLWITGYSRGAGLANIITNFFFDETDLNLKEENVFTYTFEAPKVVAKDNIKGLKNVFNFVNSYDIVPGIIPDKYDLRREGIDIDIYNEKIMGELTTKYPYLPEFGFNKTDDYETPRDFLNYVVGKLLSDTTSSTSIDTREKFMDNLFPGLSVLIEIITSMDFNELSGLVKIVEDYGIMSILFSEDLSDLEEQLYDYVVERVPSVTKEKFHTAFTLLLDVVHNVVPLLLVDVLRSMNNYMCLVLSHCDEVSYYYLINYEEK